MTFMFATIKPNNMVLFDGDVDIPKNYIPINRYYRNALYTPVSGDRVLFLHDELTKVKILQGKVVK